MEVKAPLLGYPSLPIWVGSCVLGALLAYLLPQGLAIVDTHGWGATAFWALAGALGGAVAGAGAGWIQRPVISASAPWALQWIRGTSLGWAISGAACWGLSWIVDYAPIHVLGMSLTIGAETVGCLAGLGIGMGQWLILRRGTARAGWWVLISTLSWAVGWIAAWVVFEAASMPAGASQTTEFWLLLLTIDATTAGILTGVGLRVLPKSSDKAFRSLS